MATLAPLNPTLADLTSRMDSTGKIDSRIVELLNETNEMLADATWSEATGVTENVTTVRSGLPDVAWRRLNYGVQPSKSKTKQVTDSIGRLEAYAEIDKVLADLNGNTEAWRMSENAAFLEAMNQEFQRALLYGQLVNDPARILGLTERYSTRSRTKAENAINVLDAGGTGSSAKLTSIWLMCWSPDTVFCTYPKGLPGGLQHEDLGEVTLFDANGGMYQGYRSHYMWNVGFVVRDWRYIVRIANVDTASLTKDAATGANLIDLMTDAIELLPNQAKGRPVFYCNRVVSSFLRKQIRYAENVNITMNEVAGRHVVSFDGIPVRRVDALALDETKVTAS